jgi:4-amino-4-deoxychorismate lyase
MNRLEQILARMEWTDSNVDESLLLDSEGFVVEGTATNVFIWKDDMLVTPLIDRAGVRGVMRDILIEMAKKHEMPVREARVRLEDLSEAKALLLTNSLRGICPVSWFEGQHYDSVAICQKIQPWYLEAIQVTRSDWM